MPHSNWPDVYTSPRFYDALSSIKSWPLQILATALRQPRSAAARIPVGTESQPAAARLPAATRGWGVLCTDAAAGGVGVGIWGWDVADGVGVGVGIWGWDVADGGMHVVWSAEDVYLPQQRHHACIGQLI